MADVYKPSQPMNKEGDFFFPRTTVDQVYIDPPTGKMLDAKITEMDNATAAAAAAAQAAGDAASQAEAAADGKLPLSGGDMTGWIDFGQATRGLRWKTNDGTVFTFRPYAAGNVLQVTRRMADGTEYGTLNIYANGRISVEGASDSLERVHNIMVVPAGTDVGSLSLSAGTIVMVRK